MGNQRASERLMLFSSVMVWPSKSSVSCPLRPLDKEISQAMASAE